MPLVSESITDETLRFLVGVNARSGAGLTSQPLARLFEAALLSAAAECCGPSGAVLRQHVIWQILRDTNSVAGARSPGKKL